MPYRPSPLALAATAALLGLAPSTAAAQQSARGPLACYVPGSGTVYRVKEANTPASCAAGHVEFSLAPELPSASLVSAAAASLPTNSRGAYDLSNVNGLVAAGTESSGNAPASGAGTRFMWYPNRSALRAGRVTGDQWDAGNVGNRSVAFGYNSRATGHASFAVGSGTTANGETAVAMGANSTAVGYAVAIGSSNAALGGHAIAMGLGSTATGIGSIAVGNRTTAGASYAIALGDQVVANGPSSMALGQNASTNGKLGAFVYGDRSTSTPVRAQINNHFVVRAARIWLGSTSNATATTGRFIETSTGAYLSSGGTWVNSSDVNRKRGFEAVDGERVLERIAGMPVSTWAYRDESDSVRHMGPTAQDFRAAFGLGDTDKTIATVDADGVALAAAKALERRTAELRRENRELRAQMEKLARRLTALEEGR